LPEGGGAGGKSARGEGRKRRGHSAGNAIAAQDVSGKKEGRRGEEREGSYILPQGLGDLALLGGWTDRKTDLPIPIEIL